MPLLSANKDAKHRYWIAAVGKFANKDMKHPYLNKVVP
jgi:hypothetical protein